MNNTRILNLNKFTILLYEKDKLFSEVSLHNEGNNYTYSRSETVLRIEGRFIKRF